MPYIYRPRKLRVHRGPLSEASWTHVKTFDALAQNPEQARTMSLRALRAPLFRVPRAERGVEWTERVVIAYCLARLKSARVRSLHRDIGQYWEDKGQPERAADFSARLGAV